MVYKPGRFSDYQSLAIEKCAEEVKVYRVRNSAPCFILDIYA